ncbi:MAG: hypothetical protein LBE62_02285 [Azonexus sp.]|jgi:hypothetical protein|nr:hypothetical protein [Azonexus sp.]
MTPENFLFLGPAIEARLKETLPDHIRVSQAYDLSRLADGVQLVPVVFVVYSRYQVTDASLASHAAVEQTWFTVIATRNAAQNATGNPARAEAGEIASQVVDSLLQTRFKPAKGLKLSEAPAAGSDNAGYFYLPLAWNASITFARESCP